MDEQNKLMKNKMDEQNKNDETLTWMNTPCYNQELCANVNSIFSQPRGLC